MRLKIKMMIAALVFAVLLSLSCGTEEIALKDGTSFEITSIRTGYEESRSAGTTMYIPWIRFTVVNNGTDDIQSLHVGVAFSNSYGDGIMHTEDTVHGSLSSGESADFGFQAWPDGFTSDAFYRFTNSSPRPNYAIGIGLNGAEMEFAESGDVEPRSEDF